MLSEDVVQEIKRLLAAGGLSQRQIARRLRVSRGIVGAIAHRTRHVRRRPGRNAPRPCEALRTINQGLPIRCPGCGGLVYLPCVLCNVRCYQARLKLQIEVTAGERCGAA